MATRKDSKQQRGFRKTESWWSWR